MSEITDKLDDFMLYIIDHGNDMETRRQYRHLRTLIEAQDRALSLVIRENTAHAEEVERLKSFAAGRGMASEAGGPEEIAVLVTGLHERAIEAESQWVRHVNALRGCGFELYDNGDGRTGLRGHGMIYLPEREAVSDEEAIADIMTIAANLQQMRELLDKQEGK
jgi:hypothetical protein